MCPNMNQNFDIQITKVNSQNIKFKKCYKFEVKYENLEDKALSKG